MANPNRKHPPNRGKTPFCRHCLTRRANRPKRLCWHCYFLPGVKELYASESSCAGHEGDFCGGYKLSPRPTKAPPSSAAKLRTLRRRAARGIALWHPGDARRDLS